MAIKSGSRRLSEAELNAPDLDDDGNFDVETYSLPQASFDDPYLSQVWEDARRLLEEQGEGQEIPAVEPAFDPEVEKGLVGDTVQAAGRWLARRWEQLESRYGRGPALAMAAAMLATMPLPGSVPAIIAAAEGIRGLRGYLGKEMEEEFHV